MISAPQPASPPRQGPTNPFAVFKKEEVEQSIPERFEQQVKKYGQHTAIQTSKSHLSYEDLNRAANRVAWAILNRLGEGEEPVAFLLEHGAAPIIAILGILKAGKIYVPLDASFPEARTAFMVDHAQAALILTDNANLAQAQKWTSPARSLINCDALADDRDDEAPGLSLPPDHLAYILYTSGSTGQPKGVFYNHRQVLHYTLKYTNNHHISCSDRFPLLFSCSFAMAMTDIFSSLLNGAALLPYNLQLQGVAHLRRWLRQERITFFHAIPTVFRHFVATLTDSDSFPTLRIISLGGEPITCQDVQLYQTHFEPHCLMAVELGATEAHGIRQYYLNKDSRVNGSRVPVGYALDDTEVLLLDEAGEEVGPSCVGEIAVRSPYLAVGYWRNPELTQAAFRPDPTRPGVRIYRTGDLGRLRPDGCLEHLGRKDFQVKVRGHRVETAEVEIALLELDAFKEVVVVGREDRAGGQRLLAYVVLKAKPAPTVGALRRALRETLPDYMVPSAFIPLDALPVTPTGKVDRQALPAPNDARPPLADKYCPPLDVTGQQLAETWEAYLNVRPIGIDDDFFELGGDSLLALEMLTQVEKLFGKKLAPETLLGGATLRHLGHALMAPPEGQAVPPLVEVQAGGPGRRLFFLHGNWYGGGLYCVNLARLLGKEQPFYALQPHGLLGSLVPASIEEMAADHVRTLLAFQPQGPYVLGGYCNAGLIALEMAHQLHRLGHRLDLLVIIAPPPHVRFASYSVADMPTPPHFTVWVGLPLSARTAPRRVTRPVPPLDVSRLNLADPAPVIGARYAEVIERYHIRPFPGRLAVLLPLEFMDDHKAVLRWKKAAQEVDLHFVPGGHFTVLTTHIETLAAHLRACLRKVS